MRVVDLRSDTVTVPTEEMRLAMYRTAVGDDGRVGPDGKGEDPTVRELEALGATLLGKDDAVLVPSGTMGNLVAVMAHCQPGDPVLVGSTAHIHRTEKGVFRPGLLSMTPVLMDDSCGSPDPEQVEELLNKHRPKLMCLENTHNYAGGLAMAPRDLRLLVELARRQKIPVHMDGARIFNAAVALGVDPKELAQPVDSVMFCLSKGLGAPVGSILVGSREFIRKARECRLAVGGQMRQAGVFAAAGIVALNTMVERLVEDHLKARRLAERLQECELLRLDWSGVRTNMVKVDVTASRLNARDFRDELAARGVLVTFSSDHEIRMVTHKDVSLEQVMYAADIVVGFSQQLSCVELPRKSG